MLRWWRAASENHHRGDLAGVAPLLALWQIANAAGFFWEALLKLTPSGAENKPDAQDFPPLVGF
jgi:hypothetical protein